MKNVTIKMLVHTHIVIGIKNGLSLRSMMVWGNTMNNLSTTDKILEAAMFLFSQKGYEAVTTKEIAKEANVCEMTLFRHFENKRNLFEKSFEKYIFSPSFRTLFENNLEWDLQADLIKISACYQDTLLKNQKLILMQLRNNELNWEVETPLFKFPNELKKLMINYFRKAKEKGICRENPEILAISFLAANFGLFLTYTMHHELTRNIDMQACLTEFINIFVRGIC